MEKGMAGERENGEEIEPVAEGGAAVATGAPAATAAPIERTLFDAATKDRSAIVPPEAPSAVDEAGPTPAPAAGSAPAPGPATARAASDRGPAAPIPSPAQPVSAPPDAPAVPDTEAVDQQATDTATAPEATPAAEGGATESEPGEAAGLSVAPDETAVVPDDWPTGVRKYVYIKGMGNVRWEDLDEDEKREYRERNPRVPPPGKPPPDDGGPMGSEGVDEVIT